MRVLVLSLDAHHPGVVTASIDAVKDAFGVDIDKVVTLSTKEVTTLDRRGRRQSGDCVNLVKNELEQFYSHDIKFETCYHEFKEIDSPSNVRGMWLMAGQKIYKERQAGNEVYVSLAGGNAGIDNILANVAPLFGATTLFTLSLGPQELSAVPSYEGRGNRPGFSGVVYKGTIPRLKAYPVGHKTRNRIMHPGAKALELPLFKLDFLFSKFVSGETLDDFEKILAQKADFDGLPKSWKE